MLKQAEVEFAEDNRQSVFNWLEVARPGIIVFDCLGMPEPRLVVAESS